ATTYEFLPPGRSEEGQLIRAAALVVLNEVDSVRCSYHCARLLVDEHTSDLTGEPAATAIQLLAAQGNLLPLYQRVMQGPPRPPEPSEVLAECLKHLVDLPDSLLAGVVEQHGRSTNEVVLVGLFDLLLEHRAGPSFTELVAESLRTTRAHSVYRYVVMAMVAGRKASFLALLPEVARRERDPRKLDSLVEALSLLKGNQEMDTLAEELRSRLP
ncbi:MAG: hypothetical protein ACRDI2_25115, partial [Chloroflexota bacterium]